MFNVMLPWDDPLNQTLGTPDPYEILDYDSFQNTIRRDFDKVEHYSRHVSTQTSANPSTPDE